MCLGVIRKAIPSHRMGYLRIWQEDQTTFFFIFCKKFSSRFFWFWREKPFLLIEQSIQSLPLAESILDKKSTRWTKETSIPRRKLLNRRNCLLEEKMANSWSDRFESPTQSFKTKTRLSIHLLFSSNLWKEFFGFSSRQRDLIVGFDRWFLLFPFRPFVDFDKKSSMKPIFFCASNFPECLDSSSKWDFEIWTSSFLYHQGSIRQIFVVRCG